MTTQYATALSNIATTLQALPDTNVAYYLRNIQQVSPDHKTYYINNMVLTNPNNNQNIGVLSVQGFAYTALGVNIGMNPKVDKTAQHVEYGLTDTNLYLDNFLDPAGSYDVSDIAHIVIQVIGRNRLTSQGVSMAYISFVPNPGTSYTPAIPCFVKGTPILTPAGYRAVETIRTGDLVTTAEGRVVPVSVFTCTSVTTARTAPYLIPAHTFGAYPKTDMRLSPIHAFQCGKGLWQIPGIAARSRPAICQYNVGKEITYYHVECPEYLRDNLVYDGNVVESYANRQLDSYVGHVYTWSKAKGAYTRCAGFKSSARVSRY